MSYARSPRLEVSMTIGTSIFSLPSRGSGFRVSSRRRASLDRLRDCWRPGIVLLGHGLGLVASLGGAALGGLAGGGGPCGGGPDDGPGAGGPADGVLEVRQGPELGMGGQPLFDQALDQAGAPERAAD